MTRKKTAPKKPDRKPTAKKSGSARKLGRDVHNEQILILDFGSQYTQLIARRVREENVYCEIVPFNKWAESYNLNKKYIKGLILSGGPSSVTEKGSPSVPKSIFSLGLPVLGICYGMQLMTHVLGGRVHKAEKKEYGRSELSIGQNSGGLFDGLASETVVWMSHGDKIDYPPKQFIPIAKTPNSPVAAMRHTEKPLYALQFHPEVAHTPQGKKIIGNFLRKICKCSGTWNMRSFVEYQVEKIRAQVARAGKNARVICGLSGGVDSAVTAVLVHKAIGDKLTCIFVNNGLLRHGEADEVVRTFRDSFHINLDYADAEARFLKKLAGVTDPEKKRKIIGNEFIVVFENEAKRLGGADFLAQGTLYPDVIESVSFKGPSAVIKSHHNVGGLPDVMKLELVEPLRELFKDEVRQVGLELGLPRGIINRQPFPGPGLAIRIIGAITPERLRIIRHADTIVLEEIRAAGLYESIWQSFAVLIPVKTVGVMGDERTYENIVALRAVTSLDGMTADWVQLPYDLLGRISNRIINEVRGVNRVAYDISSKPPATIEWE